MDRRRIIGGLILGCILILSGCRREALPEAGDNAIRFSMGASLISQSGPATKYGELKGDFASGDQVFVFGRRNTDNHPVFDGVIVSMADAGWNYTTPRYWNWAANTDYYDFLAMYPTYSTTAPSCDFDADPLTLSVSYNASVSPQYDLMLAGKRRTYSSDADRLGKVSLTFTHMLCAVQVKVRNGSTDDSFWLQGCHFENLVVTGVAAASFDALGAPSLTWDERSRLTTQVGGGDVGTPGERREIKTDSTNNSFTFGQDLMIPQNHSEKIGSNYPTLVVDYAVSATSPLLHARIQLKDVLTNTNAPAIPTWEMGKKYLYDIVFSLDGGVQVRVTTTNWNEVAAETPGILIPQL